MRDRLRLRGLLQSDVGDLPGGRRKLDPKLRFMSTGISVIMAVRNGEKTLSDAIRSILTQTTPPEELIIVLNGCEDGSHSVVTEFARCHPSIQFLESSAVGGVAEAAQLGCSVAQQPLIARMDCDDVAHPHRLQEQLRVLSETNADLVTSCVKSIDSLGEGLEQYVHWANSLHAPEDFLAGRFIESPVIQPGVLMTLKSYQRAGGYLIKEGPEDYDLWLRMLAQGCRFYQAPQAHLDWRDSPSRLTRSHEDYSAHHMTATKARYLALLPQVIEHGVTIAGSGPQGRRLTKYLLAENIRVHELYDVDPSKIGHRAHGILIAPPSEIGKNHPKAILLGCVGRGRREKVRTLATQLGYHEGDNFFSCC